MAARPVTVDAINIVLREARVCFCQLECIHDLLNSDPNRKNEEWRRNMEANIAMIFRDIMSYLYSVLDHIFFFSCIAIFKTMARCHLLMRCLR